MKPWLRWTLLGALVLGLTLIPFALWEEPLTALSARLLTPFAGRAALLVLVISLLASDVLLPIPRASSRRGPCRCSAPPRARSRSRSA